MATVSYQLAPEQQRALEAIALDEHCSAESLVQDVIGNFIRLKQEQERWEDHMTAGEHEAFLQEAQESLDDFDRTGLHVTHQEVLDWFVRLRKNPKALPPECHT